MSWTRRKRLYQTPEQLVLSASLTEESIALWTTSSLAVAAINFVELLSSSSGRRLRHLPLTPLLLQLQVSLPFCLGIPPQSEAFGSLARCTNEALDPTSD